MRVEDSLRVTPEIRACHRNDMHFIASNKLAKVLAKFVIGVRRNMVEFVDGDKAVVERRDSKFLDSKAKGRVGANQDFIVTFQEGADGIHFSAIISARRVTKIPLRRNTPIRPEPMLRQRRVMETCTDRTFRHNDDCLLYALIRQLVERDEHERPALSGGGRRFNE